MQTIRLKSPRQLAKHFQALGEGWLFRGQNSHYTTPSGDPSLTSSFARQGCVPPRLFKWSFFVSEMLRIMQGGSVDDDSLDMVQAMLQHYGWRSFYVDLTSSPTVAAWFASYQFEERKTLQMTKTAEEEPVLLAHFGATYVPASGDGHLYVLSREALRQQHKLIDLEDFFKTDFRDRTAVQKAWLAGMLGVRGAHLAPTAIQQHIIAPVKALRHFAADESYSTVESMFPPPEEDHFFRHLLRLPWNSLEDRGVTFGEIPIYVRSLQLPDYFVKLDQPLSPDVTLYSPQWLTVDLAQFDGMPGFSQALAVQTPEISFYGRGETDEPIPEVLALLDKHQALIFESLYLLANPRPPSSTEYVKGVYVSVENESKISVGAIIVDHPSDRISSWGIDFGYSYRRDGDRLVRQPSEDDCPCRDELRHIQHLQVLRGAERYLSEKIFTRISDRSLCLGDSSDWR
jgi:hypothetical protein